MAFWEKLAAEGLDCFKRWGRALSVGSAVREVVVNGDRNASYNNALDLHVLAGKGDKIAVIWMHEQPRDLLY